MGTRRRRLPFNELVMHWQDWSLTENNVPKSVLNTRPFETPLDPVRFPAVQDGSGGGAIHSNSSLRSLSVSGEGMHAQSSARGKRTIISCHGVIPFAPECTRRGTPSIAKRRTAK
eukprot:7963944-Pyramimonas_sp.AAC.1